MFNKLKKNISMPLVSIIIPNRNQAKWLKKSIGNAIRQNYPNIEIIFIDDASTDNSISVASRFGDKIKIIQLNNKKGPAYARNIGFLESKGQYIQFLDSDDLIAKNKISSQIKNISANKSDMDICEWKISNYTTFGNLNTPIYKPHETNDLLFETISDRSWFPVMACLFRREYLDKVGKWPENVNWNEDREYRFRLLTLKPRISFTRVPLFTYRRHSFQTHSRVFFLKRETILLVLKSNE